MVHSRIGDELMATCVILIDSGFEPSLPPQRAKTSITQPSEQSDQINYGFYSQINNSINHWRRNPLPQWPQPWGARIWGTHAPGEDLFFSALNFNNTRNFTAAVFLRETGALHLSRWHYSN